MNTYSYYSWVIEATKAGKRYVFYSAYTYDTKPECGDAMLENIAELREEGYTDFSQKINHFCGTK